MSSRTFEEYVAMLEEPERVAWQKPDEVIAALALRRDEVVAEVGCGTGYFTRRMAPHCAKVYAADTNPRLLELAKESSGSNVETLVCTATDPALPAASVDTVFFCNVFHHVGDRVGYGAALAQALKPGGRVVIVDFHKHELPLGPSVERKLSREEAQRDLESAGFEFVKSYEFLPYQYFLEFKRNKSRGDGV